MREIKVIETALRDGQQCLWATRMTTAMMLPIAERLDLAGFQAIDLMGSIQFDVCVRYLNENPWERLRLMRARIRNTPLKGGLRSKSLLTFTVLPDDVVHLWAELLVRNGLRKLSVYDALFDLDNIIETMRVAKRAGCDVGGALVFGDSPVHTDALYVRAAQRLMDEVGIGHLMLKDSGGLLTPDRICTLVPALKRVLGLVPLELHSHCMTGLAPLVYLEGVKAGAEVVQTATAPLANGASQPATQAIAADLRRMGYAVNIDDAAVDAFSRHLGAVAEQEGKPVGRPTAYDAYHYAHQLPGGMLTNLQAQLEAAGLADRFDDVLAECVLIREELGWPIMVTPFAQLVATQGVYNFMSGERYRVIPDEVKRYALGHYGKLLAPVQPDVLDRIVANGSPSIPLTPTPLPPAVAALRRQYPTASDEERLLRFMFAGPQVDQMLSAPPIATDYSVGGAPWERLMRGITHLRNLDHVSVRGRRYLVEMRRGPAG